MKNLLLLAGAALLLQDPVRLPDRWVGAFYEADWDAETGEGLTRAEGGDAFLDHPESFTDFSFRSAAWHRRNLEEMGEAGIDVALCEFADRADAVDALVKALESAARDLKRIPRVAPAVRDMAAATSFLAKVPVEFQGAVDRKRVVWLLPTKNASPEAVRKTEVFAIGAAAWNPDLVAIAGGALDGPADQKAVTLGPGFNDGSKVRSREAGAWYEKSWYAAMKIAPRVVAIESWNRFPEGSTICPTREHGRGLLEKTRKYGESFRRGQEIPRPSGKYTSAAGVSYHLKFDPPGEGLRPVELAEAPFEVVSLVGQKMLMAKSVAGSPKRILAFAVDDSYAYYEKKEYEVQLQVLDRGKGQLDLEYDAASPGKDQADRTRRAAEPFYFPDSGGWTTATFRLPEAAFANRQPGGADFRLVTKDRGLSIRWIQLRAK